MKKAAFIGVGNMGGALARAACRSIGPEQVVLFNRTPAKAEALGAELGLKIHVMHEDIFNSMHRI